MDTKPTFCANAVYGNVLNTPPSTVDSPSARSPSASRLLSIFTSTICPIARMSPVVSVMITSATMHIDTIAETSNVGKPKWNGVLTPTASASPT